MIFGNASSWFIGTGSYNNSTGTFSGSLICDPIANAAWVICGSGGNHWCGSDGSCAYNWAYNGLYGYYYVGYASPAYVVNVSALHIQFVTQQW